MEFIELLTTQKNTICTKFDSTKIISFHLIGQIFRLLKDNILYSFSVFSDLKQSRGRILELLPDPHHDIPKIESALKLYLAVLRGFLEPPSKPTNKSAEEEVASGGTRESKLRLAVRFRWSQSMLGTSTPEAQNDAAFEVS